MLEDHNKSIKHTTVNVLKWIIISVLGLSLFMMICCIFFTTKPGEKIISGILASELKKVFDNNVEIKKFETNLLSRITLEHIKIYKKTDIDTIPLLNIGNAKVHFNIFNLLSNNVSIKKITIEDIFVNIQRDYPWEF